MAEFRSFAGLRFNPEKVELSAVLAPPYDVIKGAMRDELIARSPHNVVGVELPEGEDDTKYQTAARLLQEWREQGVVVRDDAAFYVYEQEFEVPGSGAVLKRRGTLGALHLEEFGEGVKPHEHTLSGPKEDRLKLLRATRANTSPIFSLFDDNDGWISGLLDMVCAARPIAEARDAEGSTHRLWRVLDDETVNAIEAALEDEPVFIADGHHRYETALNYRNECRAEAEAAGRTWTGAEPENGVLMMCVATSDTGLVVLPTHRLVKGVAVARIDALRDALEPYFEIEFVTSLDYPEVHVATLLARINEQASDDAPRLGMHFSGQSYLLKLRPNGAHRAQMDAARSDAYNALDVTILHRLILENQLGIGAQELAAGGHVSYTIDARDAIEKVDAGEYAAAFLLRATPVEQVQEVAAAGDKMPQKSTYFYPKLMTGMVLRPLD